MLNTKRKLNHELMMKIAKMMMMMMYKEKRFSFSFRFFLFFVKEKKERWIKQMKNEENLSVPLWNNIYIYILTLQHICICSMCLFHLIVNRRRKKKKIKHNYVLLLLNFLNFPSTFFCLFFFNFSQHEHFRSSLQYNKTYINYTKEWF